MIRADISGEGLALHKMLVSIPVSINAQLGDPFQKTQWNDTKEKLTTLSSKKHTGSVALLTKSILTDEQIAFVNTSDLDLFIFTSVTGLHENKKANFDTISKNYLNLCTTNKNICVFIRPIIPEHNDTLHALAPIIELAARGQKHIIFRGYKDIVKLAGNATMDEKLVTQLKNYCLKCTVTVHDKTLFYAASLRKNHFAHMTVPLGLPVKFLQRMGYPIDSKGCKLELNPSYSWSQGDLNFIKIITGRTINLDLPDKNAILTVRPNGKMLDCSSSWFNWVRRTPCAIKCWYCISKVEALNSKKFKSLGCCPSDLLDYIEL